MTRVLLVLLALAGCTDDVGAHILWPDASPPIEPNLELLEHSDDKCPPPPPTPSCKPLVQQADPCPEWPGAHGYQCDYGAWMPGMNCNKKSDVPWTCCCVPGECDL